VVIFFIFLAANVGGALSPLGDPPLFVGFLRGVDFFWTTKTLWLPTLITTAVLLALFAALDTWFAQRDPTIAESRKPLRLRVRGTINLVLIAAIISAILAAATWKTGITFDALGTPVTLENLARDGALLVIALLSLWLTPDEHRAANGFSYEPIREVAILFAGIFTCIIPVLAMLQAGHDGAFAGLLRAVTTPDGLPHDMAYFWLTGLLSGILDNAPTYLVFFELAGGDAATLMTTHARTLAAISMGAVYMGALTYIGNAPNFMIYAIATEQGVRMPSFFGYMLWSVLALFPLFAFIALLFIA
jgi:Na+/H+ antiporter NhaD/arsenite permease-like protein